MIVNHDRRWPSEYKSPYNSRRTEWRVRTVPNLAPIVQGDFVTEALDPAALAARLRLFEAEHKKVFDGALKEVEDGCKNGHWIWSVFPQAAGIPESFGTASSKISRRFSILCFDEAVAFLEHPILGLHYVEIVEAIRVKIEEKDQHRLGGLKEIFGDDYKKVISSLTLFRRAAKVSSVAGYIWVEEEDTLFKLLTPVRLPDNTPSDPDRFKMRDTRRDLTSGISSRLALIDDCDAILENLKPCDFSQEFDRSMEREFEWRLDPFPPTRHIERFGSNNWDKAVDDALSGRPTGQAAEDEGDVELGSKPWRGDAWRS